MAEFTAHQEAAIMRTLRDIECGHITLRCMVRRYDERTGARLADPELIETGSDREPAPGFPRHDREPWECWWDLLAQRGWIRLPTETEPGCWQVTDAGRRMLAPPCPDPRRAGERLAWAMLAKPLGRIMPADAGPTVPDDLSSVALLELAEWLVSLDEPGSTDRRTVTLDQIITRARKALGIEG